MTQLVLHIDETLVDIGTVAVFSVDQVQYVAFILVTVCRNGVCSKCPMNV